MTSQDKIIRAFLDLLMKNDYDQITITKIMERCRLPRTYYYEFFDNKEDLAQEAFYTTMYPIFHLFAESFKPDGTINRQIATQGVRYLADHGKLAKQLFKIQVNDDDFLTQYQQRTKGIIKTRLKTVSHAPAIKVDFVAELFTASAIATINWYWRQSAAITPSQLVGFIIAAYEQGLSQILKD